ncbi:MAG: ribonuclease III [Rhodospirillales bacterium]
MSRRTTQLSRGAAADDLGGLEKSLGHRFKDRELLVRAVTHSSAASSRVRSNERFEFLGDRVLGLVVARLLVDTFPDEAEGELGYRFTALVRSETLARVAGDIGLAPYVRLSKAEADAGGRENPNLLANCCEAVIAALYLDGGLAAGEAFIGRHWRPLMAEDPVPPKDAKTVLQEWAQAQGLPLPRYRVTGEKGPAHSPVFLVEATIQGREPARAEGANKRAAEQAAAQILLQRIEAEQ